MYSVFSLLRYFLFRISFMEAMFKVFGKHTCFQAILRLIKLPSISGIAEISDTNDDLYRRGLKMLTSLLRFVNPMSNWTIG